ncbi:hypothetical protein ISN45_Aa02g011730 [Arabidopsis thaliana x Arabidopsis arenosa]|uniref:Uncharacterized protein n=1 Tax=Arabidopsis thaliana x Arabidopsis arenosa TaxID=1240361 RepID=A0A8T2BG71_9BRAS|nr:hypothetical protein ISN45_Aa02g011730 [Arabidopsis thaliana x Arabidopsis arenosa]
MAPKGKSSQGREGGQNTRAVAAGGGQNTRVVAAGGGQNTRPVAAGGGQTSSRGGGQTSRPVASRVRTYVGQRPPLTTSGVGASSHSSNPSVTQSTTQSHATRPLSQQTPTPQPHHQPQPPSPPPSLYRNMMRITKFNRHNRRLSRAISRIFRRKFDGPYYSWKVTPVDKRERYFRAFVREFNWDIGITALLRAGILVITKKRMKGIVTQVKKTGVQPTWVGNTLWTEMQQYWKTVDAIERSNPYGLGSLAETLHKGKRKDSYASSSSTITIVELQDQLRRKISDQDSENVRRDAEHRTSQARIASLEKLILFLKEKDPDLVAFMSSSPLLQPAVIIPPGTQTDTLPTTTEAAIQPNGLAPTETTPASTISNTASNPMN